MSHPEKETSTQKFEVEVLLGYVLNVLREVTGLDEKSLTNNTLFSEIGLESLSILNFNSKINLHFPNTPKTLLFDCQTPQDAALQLITLAPEAASKLIANLAPTTSPKTSEISSPSQKDQWPELPIINNSFQSEDIAIIGMHGQFPDATQLSDFWQNLTQGQDSISEIPPKRWSLKNFFEKGSASRSSGLSYAKWGGFLSDIDHFDTQFFGIPHREAALIDPQERLFLQCAWHVMEDAALLGERSNQIRSENGALDIGVFLGITTNTYPLLGPTSWDSNFSKIPSGMPWSAANRVSYCLNMCGPSLAIDTACSSSLVAIHNAIESLRNKECQAALVGGVNLYTHPAKYVQLCQQQMLSPTGRCHSFGADADGFVPGEGVGAVLIKPLSSALRDGDRVQAVIKGSAINHGGQTNGYTVPSPASQAKLIKDALLKSGLEAESISYIEAHGTGTKLGDPIEIEALKQALFSESNTPETCAVGSVKSNIGHLESAAGIASLIKTCLQFKHRQIPPSLHSSELNPDLGIEGTRFRIPQKLENWTPADGIMRAGISSFGAGGANAHVIVEQAPAQPSSEKVMGPLLFPISARSTEQLQQLADDLRHYAEQIQSPINQQDFLSSLAYTLQCGRSENSHRCVFIADSIQQLIQSCNDFCNQQNANSSWFSGKVNLTNKPNNQQQSKLNITEIAQGWVNGETVTWSSYWAVTPPLTQAPLYPFAKESHWFNNEQQPAQQQNQLNFDGNEFYLKDHVIKAEKVLPAAAYIDILQRQIQTQHATTVCELYDLTWATPVTLKGLEHRSINCIVESNTPRSGVTFSSITDDNKQAVHFRGKYSINNNISAYTPHLSLDALRQHCSQPISTTDFYANFEALDIHYGPSFQCINKVWKGDNACLAELKLRHSGREGQPITTLDPALLDGVLQSAFFAANTSAETIHSAYIPYSCKKLSLFAALTETIYVHAEKLDTNSAETETFNFHVYSQQGQLLLTIEDFSFRNYSPQASQHKPHILRPVWNSTPLLTANNHEGDQKNILLFDQNRELYDQYKHKLSGRLWLQQAATAFSFYDQTIINADPTNQQQFGLLTRLLQEQSAQPDTVIFNLHHSENLANAPAWESHLRLNGTTQLISSLRSLCESKISTRMHIIVLLPTHSNSALTGMLKSIHQEIPTISASVIEQDNLTGELGPLTTEITSGPKEGVVHIRLNDSGRWQKQLEFDPQQIPVKTETTTNFQTGDSILITGGLGAIGQLFAKNLANQGGLTLHIVGRKPQSAVQQETLKTLIELGAARAYYWSADCANEEQVQLLIEQIHNKSGSLQGVIHCAGMLKDDFFSKLSTYDLEEVICAKSLSAYWLDQYTKADTIKHFVLCSSLAGIHGNIGQSSYALANAWLDNFAEQRNQLSSRGSRSGHCISIAWPLWQTSTGMQATEYVTEWLSSNGLSLLPEETGVKLFQHALTQTHSVMIPVHGKQKAVAKIMGITSTAMPHTQTPSSIPEVSGNVAQKLQKYLSQHLSKVTGTPIEKIDPESALDALGLDSILVMEVNGLLENDFPELSKTALFEVRSINELSQLIIEEHSNDVATLFPTDTETVKDLPFNEVHHPEQNNSPRQNGFTDNDIAIIGLAGQYPESSNLNDLWKHLSEGNDLVREIPTRWPQTEGKDSAYARWGSFIEDFDKFDPLFFGISPRDAERMDPQERLFLQSAWHAVEDAGYTPDSLSGARNSKERQRVGVIAGVMYGEYQFYGAQSWPQRPETLTNSSYASIANRVSYCMDLDGPSFAVDSMCSSSLTSIHVACQLLQSGGCEVALAGGVNISSHPYKYRMLSDLQFASTEGKCRSFGEGGDGYVPGEGVGVVVLKPLSAAERDNDHIYAVIRGSDLNHGGRTSGYTVPNADAQAQVISRAFERCKTPVEQLGYIEAHGTGTSLGDPIEIRGLTKALKNQVSANWQCPIGSIKSNLGHLESAAGMAALTKVLLQLKYQKLVPSIHSEKLNSKIDFQRSPFYVQQTLSDWKPQQAPNGQTLPRLAAISSFGAGGANAHLVIEEQLTSAPAKKATNEQLFMFSAHSHNQLQEMLIQFQTYLQSAELSTDKLLLGKEQFTTADVAQTLCHGRVHHPVRAAFIANNFQSLIHQIKHWLQQPSERKAEGAIFDIQSVSESLSNQARAWLSGEPFSMPSAYWRKVPLPGYQFLKRRYWATTEEVSSYTPAAEAKTAPTPATQERTPKQIREPDFDSPEAKLTPSEVLDLIERNEISEEKARELLLAMA